MIVYLTSADHAYTLNRYLQEWAPELSGQMQPVFYEESPWDWLVLEATYVFSDIERLTPSERLNAAVYADHLSSLGYRVLNHPNQAPMRLELQTILHEAGINPFRMFSIRNYPELKFPVFLRLANSHQGSIGDLIHSQAGLEQRLAALDEKTVHAEDLVVVEYCDTRSTKGRYIKYSAMRVGSALVPRHAISSEQWMLKVPDIIDTESIRIENEFLLNFPQKEAIDHIFSLAKLDFGRIDFGIENGEIRVWEINTNPTFMPVKKGLHAARKQIIHKTNEWLIAAFMLLNTESSEAVRWQRIAKRHVQKHQFWWLQRKLFRRKRA